MRKLGSNNTTDSSKVAGGMTSKDVVSVAAGAVTPWNTGDNSEIRTEKVVVKHRNFSKKEADELRVKAAKRKREAKDNRKAYQALRKIESADATDQTSFRGYQTTVARVTATKKSADVAKAKTLAGLTPVYANLGYSLDDANTEAAVKVREYQELYAAVDNRWK